MAAQRNPSRNASGRTEAAWGSRPTDQLDDWLAIEPDGMITAFSGKVELGTGTLTALAQIVAEELDVPVDRVHMVMGDTERTPNEGYTAGSMTVQSSGEALRQAAAEARRLLLDLASAALDVPISELVVKDGIISVRGDAKRSITYAALMGGKLFDKIVPERGAVKRADAYHLVGSSVPRVDLPLKITGQASFIQDLRLPGMLHARVVRPPSVNAKFISLDEASIRNVPGLVRFVQFGNFIGVIAEREEQAIQAAQSLSVKWEETPSLPPMADLYKHLRSLPALEQPLTEPVDIEAAFKGATRQYHAEYFQPYQAHASIGPSCAVADVGRGQCHRLGQHTGAVPFAGRARPTAQAAGGKGPSHPRGGSRELRPERLR